MTAFQERTALVELPGGSLYAAPLMYAAPLLL